MCIHAHVKAHILLCFMALTLVCLLEKKLHDDGHFLSIDQIIEVMNNMTLSKARISKKKEPVYIVNKAISDDRTYEPTMYQMKVLLKRLL